MHLWIDRRRWALAGRAGEALPSAELFRSAGRRVAIGGSIEAAAIDDCARMGRPLMAPEEVGACLPLLSLGPSSAGEVRRPGTCC